MNRRFVTIFFIPGAAGNFIARCLNLLTGFNVFEPANPNENKMPDAINEKLELLNYNKVLNWGATNQTKSEFTWVNFEHQLVPYEMFKGHCDFPLGGVGVRALHPVHSKLKYLEQFIGQDDEKFVFYIDPTGVWNWMLVHADMKDSHQSVAWFKHGKNLLNDPDIFKISLKNIVNSQESFIEEFSKICKIIKHQLSEEELDAVLFLYKQWKTTTLNDETVKLKKIEMLDQVTHWYNEIITNLNDSR
jgi:hypothetical protein